MEKICTYEKVPRPPVVVYAYENVQKTEDNNYVAFCKFCKFSSKRKISFSRSSSSNLVRHLKTNHKGYYKQYMTSRNKKLPYSKLKPFNLNQESEVDTSSTITPTVATSTNSQCRIAISEECTSKILPLISTEGSSSTLATTSSCVPLLAATGLPQTETTKAADIVTSDQTIPCSLPSILTTNCESTNFSLNKNFETENTIVTKQATLNFNLPKCVCCQEIAYLKKIHSGGLTEIMKGCTHKSIDCCCRKTLKDSNLALSPSIDISEIANSPFSYKLDSKTKEVRVYCLVCLKSGNKKGGRRRTYDYSWTNGIIFKSKARENKDKQKHLQSAAHKEASEFIEFEDNEQTRNGLPTSKEQRKFTENAMVAGMFMAGSSLSHRLYPNLCAFLSLITPDNLPHPLGNRHQAHNSIKKILNSNLKAVENKVKRDLLQSLTATDLPPQCTLSADKGTAFKDITRQAVVVTCLNNDGMPHETLLGVPQVRNGSADATANNLKECIKPFLDSKQVAFIATDSAGYYVGKHSGMIERLKSDPEFGTVIGLPDFCHKVERLMDFSMPKWVSSTIENCKLITNFVNEHQNVKNHIHEYINVVDGTVFVVIPTMSETRFAQYLHLNLDSILRNIKVFMASLPSLIDNTLLSDKATKVLKLITNNIFVAKVMVISDLYKKISLLEKEAQSESFGPFQYMNLVTKFRELVKEDISADIKNLIETNIFAHVDNHNPGNFTGIDFASGQNLTKTRQERLECSLPIFEKDVYSWYANIQKNIDVYLHIPNAMKLVARCLSLHELSIDSTVREHSLRELFHTTNTKFEKCSESCKGYSSCKCLITDYLRFVDHFQSNFNCVDNYQLNYKDSDTAITYVEAFARYLSIDGLHKEIKSNNIMRLLELTSIMKASQSATERVMNHVANTVKNRFESKLQFQKECNEDPVNTEVFLKFNGNFVDFDKKYAAHEFSKRHYDTAIKSKPLTYRSKTVQNVIRDLTSKNSSKRKSKCFKNAPKDSIALSVPESDTTNKNVSSPLVSDIPNTFSKTITAEEKNEGKLTSCKTPPVIYCLCQANEYNALYRWVGCENRENCVSYQQRKSTTGADGGDWFHVKCLKIKNIPKGDWHCDKCIKANSEFNTSDVCKLQTCLKRENRCIVKIPGDGNCIFRALAYGVYGSDCRHEEIRRKIAEKLISLTEDSKFDNRWLPESWFPENKQSPDRYYDEHLVRQLVCSGSVDTKNKTSRAVANEYKLYGLQMKTPALECHTARTRYGKYGGDIDLTIFSSLYQVNVWILRPVFGEKLFKWFLVNSAIHENYERNKTYNNYVTLLYRPSNVHSFLNHYDAIIGIDEIKLPPPSDERQYLNDENILSPC